MSALTTVYKELSPETTKSPSKTKIVGVESINQRCDLMLSEQLTYLQDIQITLDDTLDQLEAGIYRCKDKCLATATSLFEQAQHGSVLVSCIGKMHTELIHSRLDLQQLITSPDRDAPARLHERVRWLENRIEQVLLLHRQEVLEGKRAKMTSSMSSSSSPKLTPTSDKLMSELSFEKANISTVNLGPLPFPSDGSLGGTTVTPKSVKSPKGASSTVTTRFTLPSTTTKSDDVLNDLLWGKKSANQPIWHTLPLVPRSPIELSCEPFDVNVPWLDRRGSSYELLREEFNQLLDKVGRVYDHIQAIVDNSRERDPDVPSPTHVSSRMSRTVGDGKSEYDCYGLEQPVPIKWSRLSRKQWNIYPRPTRTWHNGVYLTPVRRIANQQQQQNAPSLSRENTMTKSEGVRIFSRSKLARAKQRASVSLQRLKGVAAQVTAPESTGALLAQNERVQFLINNNLKSDIAKVRKETVRDLRILYKNRPSYAIINALKETVYTDDNMFVLIEASISLLSVGVWDTAAIEIVLQALKYGSKDLRHTLLEALRTSSSPHLINKQSVQFRVLHGLLLNLIKRGSHLSQGEGKEEEEEGSQPPPVGKAESFAMIGREEEVAEQASAAQDKVKNDDLLASQAALVCAYFYITDEEVKDCLLYFLTKGDEDLQSLCLVALTKKLVHRSPGVVMSCLHQMKTAVKWENRDAAAKLIEEYKVCIEEYGLSQKVFTDLEVLLYDECAREVRTTAAKVITSLGLHAKMLQVVIRKLDDVNEDVRAQGVMSLSILGIKGKSLLNQLLDILELDSSIFVRIQVMRAVKELNIGDRRVVRLLRERARGSGPMSKEARIALYSITGEIE